MADPMAPDEVRSARARLDWSIEQAAATFGTSPDAVARWERGQEPIPGLASDQLRWFVRFAEQSRALEESGLPECEWIREWEARRSDDFEEAEIQVHVEDRFIVEDELGTVTRHMADCPTCQARERYLEDRFGPMPPFPLPRHERALRWIGGRARAIPSWLRPAALGAVVLGGIVLLRVLGSVPRLIRAPNELPDALLALGAAAGAGASGGLVYSAVRSPLRRLGRAGDYVTGLAMAGAYIGALMLAAPYAFGERLAEGTEAWTIWAAGTVVIGLVVGHTWFGDDGLD